MWHSLWQSTFFIISHKILEKGHAQCIAHEGEHQPCMWVSRQVEAAVMLAGACYCKIQNKTISERKFTDLINLPIILGSFKYRTYVPLCACQSISLLTSCWNICAHLVCGLVKLTTAQPVTCRFLCFVPTGLIKIKGCHIFF